MQRKLLTNGNVFKRTDGRWGGEILALNNRDIDIEKRQMKIQNSMKEVYNREGTKATGGKSAKVGKTKTLTSKLHRTAE